MPDEPSPTVSSGIELPLAGGRLTIDLGALVANYRLLAQLSAPAQALAVVKADAYGLGIEPVVNALWNAGCRRFFVALPEEGFRVRKAAPEAGIMVLSGLFGVDAAAAFVEARLIPVLNSQTDIAIWEAHGWDGDVPRPCVIHVDTGMNRLGLTLEAARAFAEENALTRALTPVMIMSHLACGDDSGHPMNRRQLELFQELRAIFPGIESSLANSAGVFLTKDFHFEATRPGIALYGGNPSAAGNNPMRPVVTAEARILQVRQAKTGTAVSYGASQILTRDSLIAIASVGYADGYHRSASGAGVPLRHGGTRGAAGFLHGRRVPVVGRVTMDLTMFDVTELGPGAVGPGDFIEIFGPNMPIDDVAKAAGTISYELLTSIGRRYHRTYVGTA
ncbi:alanine racemase [Mesorhizobium sp. J18]|uniref:alanine racemase n=1 Tax=Mesorhizobium sp. J18 TaxID=935263 RepID=UPI001199FF09|nr:alanine racemase [Mesorhizobium sp. J18]TWG93733.1 alanine racemase [Mesorhizobium sp. J18]